MASFKGVIRSGALAMDTGLNIILPQDRPFEPDSAPARVLYLLHGLGDNCEAWTRYTNIERYAREYKLAVIMPEVQRSFYFDMEYGLKYFEYVSRELPELCGQMFGISAKREDTFIAGLSMGGYGALKCALTNPEKYAGCASFSGVPNIRTVLDEHVNEANKKERQSVFGTELVIKEKDDPYSLAGQLALTPAGNRPKIYISCGRQDFLYKINAEYDLHLRRLGIEHKYMEWDGEHEWGFWDKSIQYALHYFFE
ncbi:tributyrin esterase [Clostridia bacterium]|nr:tributyrin esterase [Clostridia bacterium]